MTWSPFFDSHLPDLFSEPGIPWLRMKQPRERTVFPLWLRFIFCSCSSPRVVLWTGFCSNSHRCIKRRRQASSGTSTSKWQSKRRNLQGRPLSTSEKWNTSSGCCKRSRNPSMKLCSRRGKLLPGSFHKQIASNWLEGGGGRECRTCCESPIWCTLSAFALLPLLCWIENTISPLSLPLPQPSKPWRK